MLKSELLDRLSAEFGIGEIRDVSLNGLQVDSSRKEIGKIAFAVDACLESIRRAADFGAGMLFVHHGLFWKKPVAVTGSHYERIKALLGSDIALYAVHLPLDMHPTLGNNAVMADAIGLTDREPFGEFMGQQVGLRGRLKAPLTVSECAERLGFTAAGDLKTLCFGKKLNETVAIVSGADAEDIVVANAIGVDLFITGEHSHAHYHFAEEERINMICGGHYASEVFGVKAVAEFVGREYGVESIFVDVPTGM